MTITTQLFKEFTSDRLKELSNKKDMQTHDECIDIYSKTQLFDFKNINKLKDVYGKYVNIDDNDGDIRMFFENESFNIPFESCFINLMSGKNTNIYVFLHDYKPNIITGRYIEKAGNTWLEIVFQIENIFNGWNLVLRTKDLLNDCEILSDTTKREKLFNTIIDGAGSRIAFIKEVFNKLSSKTILLDCPITLNPRYYRYKSKKRGALKVNAKPIYIVLDKKKSNINYNYSNIEKQGRLEYNFAFPVIGHWRRLSDLYKIGKDREDNYAVEGFTWIKSHIRGDKNSPIIQRERIII